jgi:hypothetical protein
VSAGRAGAALPAAPATSGEIELLLACARTRIDPDTTARVRALAARDVDWRRLVTLARWHGVAPLVQRQLSLVSPAGLPRKQLRQLQADVDQNAIVSLRLAAHLQPLLAALDRADIVAIPYKGPALAATAYGSLVLRVYGDLDLLVRAEDLERTRQVLRRLNYRPQLPLTELEEALLDQAERAQGFVDERGTVTVEVHPAVTPRALAAGVDHRVLFEQLESIRVGETEVRTFSPEAHLLALCLHGTKHLWARVLWICDVSELVRARPDMDWDRLMAWAREWRVQRMLRLGLNLAIELLGAGVPDHVRDQTRADAGVRALTAEVRRRLVRPPRDAPSALSDARFHLRALDDWGDRLRYCWLFARPSEADWEARRLPGPLRVLHYPLRAFRLLVRGPGHGHPEPQDGWRRREP